MDSHNNTPAKRSFSQQILRTFLGSSSLGLASLGASSPALPLPTAVDYSLGVGTSSFAQASPSLDAAPTVPGFPATTSQTTVLGSQHGTSLGPYLPPATFSDYAGHIEELRKPLPLSQPRREDVIRDRTRRLVALTAAVSAAVRAAASDVDTPSSSARRRTTGANDTKQARSGSASSSKSKTADRGASSVPSQLPPVEPPLGDVLALCILLLGEAREFPMALRVATCDLMTEAVKLSDIRAAVGPKAVSETRSGAPGSQSSKSTHEAQALANIDRALLFRLASDLSFGAEEQTPTQDDISATALPALPSQLKAFSVLSNQGRDVVALRGIVELLVAWLTTMWTELQVLRNFSRRRIPVHSAASVVEIGEHDSERDHGARAGPGQPHQTHTSGQQRRQAHAGAESAASSTSTGASSTSLLVEQISIREWNLSAAYALLTSIFKFSFARVELRSVQSVLHHVADLFVGQAPLQALASAAASVAQTRGDGAPINQTVTGEVASELTAQRQRARSREAKRLVEGYDYYGLSVITPESASEAASPSFTPRVMTPKLAARGAPADLSSSMTSGWGSAAPIGLATLPARAGALENIALHAPTTAIAELHESDVRLALLLFDATLCYGYMPPDCVGDVVTAVCAILGYPAAVASSSTTSAVAGMDWLALSAPLMANILRSHCANSAIRYARNRLIDIKEWSTPFGVGGMANMASHAGASNTLELAIDIGAVVFLRFALSAVAGQAEQARSNRSRADGIDGSSKAADDAEEDAAKRQEALGPRLTLPLLMPALRGALRRHSDRLDLEVLRLVAELVLVRPESRERTKPAASTSSDAQGEDGRIAGVPALLPDGLTLGDWDELLDLAVGARRHVEGWKLKGGAPSPFDPTLWSGEREGWDSKPIDTPPVVEAMLQLLSSLNLASPTAIPAHVTGSLGKDEGHAHIPSPIMPATSPLPWTDKLAALLLSLAPLLPDPMVVDLVRYYQAQHLCLPCTPDWLANIRSLLHAFFHRHENAARDFGALPAPRARHALVHLLFEHAYDAVRDMPEHRADLLLDIIIPLAEVGLANEADAKVEDAMRRVLVEAAATAGSRSPEDCGEGVDAEAGDGARLAEITSEPSGAPSQVQGDPTISPRAMPKSTSRGDDRHSRILNGIRALFVKIARSRHETSITLAPPSSISAEGCPNHTEPRSDSTSGTKAQRDGGKSATPSTTKAQRAALDLIAIFNRMGFTSLEEVSSTRERLAAEIQCRAGCIAVFRDLLALLQPRVDTASSTGGVSTGFAGDTETVPSTTPEHRPLTASTEARLSILQWLLRIRTDKQHRVYIVSDLDDLVVGTATTLLRGPSRDETSPASGNGAATFRDSTAAIAAQREGRTGVSAARSNAWGSARSSSRARETSFDPDGEHDRGRGTKREDRRQKLRPGDRSISATRTRPTQGTPPTHNPMWTIPERVAFELPPPLRSDIVFTYIHPHDDPYCSHGHTHSSVNHGEAPVPLPISEWLRTAIVLLQHETDWELLSYLLSFLPHQLANKHLFCGPKARDQVRELRRMLCGCLIRQALVPEARIPDMVNKAHVYSAAYAALTVLMSYRTLFSSEDQDEIVEAFMTGLSKAQSTAQVCVRALSVACYELQDSFTRRLPSMLVRLSNVMSSVAMSVHILELMGSVGHMPSCYQHFGESEYRRIFGIALQYIRFHIQYQMHHHQHQQREGVQQPSPGHQGAHPHQQPQQSHPQDATSFGPTFGKDEDILSNPTTFALSQYVMMLAHYTISLWFMSLPISERSKYVTHIIRGLLVANQGRDRFSDQTEVCFDFLARFTHSNAEPKPRKSFLNRIVSTSAAMHGDGRGRDVQESPLITKSWLYGVSIVTVSTLRKLGWVEILVRRPSGTMSMLCKIENAPVATLPEEDGDRVELPAVLMMQRDPDRAARPVQPAPALPPRSFEARQALGGRGIRQRAEQRLRTGDYLRSRRVHGPAHFGLMTKKPRSASFSGALGSEEPAWIVVSKEASPYAKRTDEEGDAVRDRSDPQYRLSVAAARRRSDALHQVMTEALGENLAAPSASGAANPVESCNENSKEARVRRPDGAEVVQSPGSAQSSALEEGSRVSQNKENSTHAPIKRDATSDRQASLAAPPPAVVQSPGDRTQSLAVRSPAAPARKAADIVINPGFIALQLSAYPDIALEREPLLLPDDGQTARMIKSVDLTPVVDFHRIGVLYVGPGQRTEAEILGNRTGSPAYVKFIAGLGDLIRLRGQEDVYTGGLDRQNDENGTHTYVWGDDISQIVFHTATLMPNREHDVAHSAKKSLIGNDYVHIVFNESGDEYQFGTISSQFNYVNIVIAPTTRGGTNLGAVAPQDDVFYRISLQRLPGLPTFSPLGDGQLLSASAMPLFVRHLALNANLFSQVWSQTAEMRPYTSSWVSRLHHIKRYRALLQTKMGREPTPPRSAMSQCLFDFSAHF